VKYDWYDPNTEVSEEEIGKSVISTTANPMKATSSTDLKYTTLGLGLAYRWDANIKITAYYDMVTNETSSSLKGISSSGAHESGKDYTIDLPDNVFTLRVQMKF
jgi:hypothetical protein